MSAPTQNLRQPLTDQEKQFYGSIFKKLDEESLGIVTGETARTTFEKSSLPPPVLGEIWQIADPTNLGFLTQFAFSVALRLIGHVQNGAKPDKALIDYSGPIAKFQGITGPRSTTATVPALQHSASGSVSSQQPLQPQFTSLPPLTNHDISKFSQLLAKSAPTGLIPGDQARNIFLKAKLPTNILSEIWALVDRQNRGQLDRDEFSAAMFLIQGTMNGSIRQLPPSVPQYIWDQLRMYQSPITTGGSNTGGSSSQLAVERPNVSRVPSSFANASNDWIISQQKRAQFDNIFEGLDKESKGVLGPSEIAPFLTTSKLPQDVLASIWDLSDIHNTGEFSKTEFAIAMFLVQKKIAGAELPHVIPETLLPDHHPAVANQGYQQQAPVAAPQHAEKSIPNIPSRDTKPKSSLTDLVDLNDAFSTPSPPIPEAKLPEKESSRSASNSTVQYTPAGGAPKPFVPSSTFGQEIFEKQKVESPAPKVASLAPVPAPTQLKSPEAPSFQPQSTGDQFTPQLSGSREQKSVTVPVSNTQNRVPSFQSTSSFSQQPSGTRGFLQNDDLLADSNPEVSGQLSRATADMANLSTQIGSLSNQTSQLHEKRGRAEKELAKITNLKKDIEAKLSQLRVAYEQEVKQTEQVESLLRSSKDETEQLRKEASVAEAQHNTAQTQLQNLQSELEESQKENASLKERLGNLNAEHIEVQKQLERVQGEVRQSKGLAAINSKQLSTTETTSNNIKEEIVTLLASVKELDSHHENYTKKQGELESLKQAIEENERSLSERKQSHEQAELELRSKDDELSARLQEQQQREAQIQQHEAHIQQLFANLQEGQRQLEDAENLLQEQQVQYAQRVQEFSSRQIEESSSGYHAASRDIESESKGFITNEVPESTLGGIETSIGEAPRDSEKSSATKDSGSSKGLLGAAVGVVAGAIGGTAIAAVSGTTESEKGNNTEFSSPIAGTTEQTTSVNSDDYQYETGRDVDPQFHLPIERPESATSSVQNNAPQSVRGDDIEESNQNIDTVIESPALASDVLSKNYKTRERPFETTENIESAESTGAGSFEIVDSNKSESDLTLTAATAGQQQIADKVESSMPGAWNVESAIPETSQEIQQEVAEAEDPEPRPSLAGTELNDVSSPVDAEDEDAETPARSTSVNEEFPPIQELNINESESDDEEFHETSENIPDRAAKSTEHTGIAAALGVAGGVGAAVVGSSALSEDETRKNFNFETSFGSSKPSEKRAAELFQDDFEGLEAAQEDTAGDEDEFNQSKDFDDQLEGSNFYGADSFSQPQQLSEFDQQPQQGQSTGEWEQIFAGFGNDNPQGQDPHQQQVQPPHQQQPSHPYSQHLFGSQNTQQKVVQPEPTHPNQSPPTANRRIATTPRSLAVQELTGMGFSEKEALEALTKEKWNLEAATNHLLDNA